MTRINHALIYNDEDLICEDEYDMYGYDDSEDDDEYNYAYDGRRGGYSRSDFKKRQQEVIFHRPDGDTEMKSVGWLMDNGFWDESERPPPSALQRARQNQKDRKRATNKRRTQLFQEMFSDDSLCSESRQREIRKELDQLHEEDAVAAAELEIVSEEQSTPTIQTPQTAAEKKARAEKVRQKVRDNRRGELLDDLYSGVCPKWREIEIRKELDRMEEEDETMKVAEVLGRESKIPKELADPGIESQTEAICGPVHITKSMDMERSKSESIEDNVFNLVQYLSTVKDTYLCIVAVSGLSLRPHMPLCLRYETSSGTVIGRTGS